ncbi:MULTISPECIES: hypothetical protein [unclassified Curtobacterium]|uniref:hypothetical protein n=1 Tax=unclassified Curtobacterium TaxID=257496 RepID=UPI0011146C04|nr:MULTISPECIES: hypothetical protein [unclassified Curtobacterium]
MDQQQRSPDSVVVAYLVGIPLAVAGFALVFSSDLNGLGAVGAVAAVCGVLLVCTGMIVSAISRR